MTVLAAVSVNLHGFPAHREAVGTAGAGKPSGGGDAAKGASRPHFAVLKYVITPAAGWIADTGDAFGLARFSQHHAHIGRLNPVAEKLRATLGRFVNSGAVRWHVEAADIAGRHVEFGKALVLWLKFNGQGRGGQRKYGEG